VNSPRIAAVTREAARLLRTPGAHQNVLRVLRCCPVTALQLCYLLRERYRPRSVYAALARLRAVGLAEPDGRRKAWPGGWSRVWRCV
jgi:hypothetical protein